MAIQWQDDAQDHSKIKITLYSYIRSRVAIANKLYENIMASSTGIFLSSLQILILWLCHEPYNRKIKFHVKFLCHMVLHVNKLYHY